MCCRNVINTSQWLTLGKRRSAALGQGGKCDAPKIRNEIGTEDLEETKSVDGIVQSDKPQEDADI